MDKRDASLVGLLLGQAGTTPLENRVLGAALLGATLISGLLLLVAVIAHSPLAVYLLAVWAIVAFGTLYSINRCRPRNRHLIWCFLLALYITLFCEYVWIGGVFGIAYPVLVAVAAVLPILARPDQLVPALASLFVFFGVLAGSTVSLPDTIPVFQPTWPEIHRSLLETAIICGGLVAVTYLVVDAYRRQRDIATALNDDLARRNRELEDALQEVKVLRGFIPICSGCKKIRNDDGYYEAVEEYITRHTDADFTHTICRDCVQRLYPELAAEMEAIASDRPDEGKREK